MDNMPYLHEASVLNNLKHRFQMNQIYTCTGPILIAMNPFKWLDIYDTPFVEKYHQAVALEDLPSHCYQIAERVFRFVFADSRTRPSLCVGRAGREDRDTKLMLHYFSMVAGSDAFDHGADGGSWTAIPCWRRLETPRPCGTTTVVGLANTCRYFSTGTPSSCAPGPSAASCWRRAGPSSSQT